MPSDEHVRSVCTRVNTPSPVSTSTHQFPANSKLEGAKNRGVWLEDTRMKRKPIIKRQGFSRGGWYFLPSTEGAKFPETVTHGLTLYGGLTVFSPISRRTWPDSSLSIYRSKGGEQQRHWAPQGAGTSPQPMRPHLPSTRMFNEQHWFPPAKNRDGRNHHVFLTLRIKCTYWKVTLFKPYNLKSSGSDRSLTLEANDWSQPPLPITGQSASSRSDVEC